MSNELYMLIKSDSYNLEIVLILTVGFTLATLLGYFSQLIKLSPILGFLLAGYIIGPYFPGLVVDMHLSEQLAELGVVLMMFGVGMHFKWQDLAKVRNIALPGAIGQTFIATVFSAILIHSLGFSWATGTIIGCSIGVASTVVMIRMLSDQQLLETPQGHIAVGWLIVEDILTVAILILLPIIASLFNGDHIEFNDVAYAVVALILKFLILAATMFTIGHRIVTYALIKVARTQSSELFTLAVLSLTFLIAVGSSYIFGTSIALGAFIAGMVIGQTEVRHQASAYASPMKDAFVVFFFLSVGMLFNPWAIVENFSLFISVLSVILIIKPLAAFFIVIMGKYSLNSALIIAIALAQIGEFSFILAEEALKFHLLPDVGYDVIVACAIISISINPLLFNLLDYWNRYRNDTGKESRRQPGKDPYTLSPRAIIIGYGYVGQQLRTTVKKLGFMPVVIDRDVDSIAKLIEEKQEAIYGDASIQSMLEAAQIKSARFLIITISDTTSIINIIRVARQIQPQIIIFVRIKEKEEEIHLQQLSVNFMCCDEDEILRTLQASVMGFSKASFSIHPSASKFSDNV